MSPRLPRVPPPAIVAIVLALTGAVWLVRLLGDEGAAREEAVQLRDSLRISRLRVDSCQVDLTREEMDFREHDERVDSLLERVRAYEAMDRRGVPGDSYPDYLETFDRYNASVEAWEARADTLRARWAACQERVLAHNALADSVRARLAELGYLPAEAAEAPAASGGGGGAPSVPRSAPSPSAPPAGSERPAAPPAGPYEWGTFSPDSGGAR